MVKILSDLIQIFKSSVSAVLPDKVIKNCISYDSLTEAAIICGQNYNLKNKNLYIIGTGKAVQYMAIEAENIFSSKIKKGIISIPKGSLNNKTPKQNVMYLEGAQNNLPDENAVSTASKIKDLVMKLTKDDFLLVFISGGGSALLSLPKDPITLGEKTALIKKLASSGADIVELNVVRKTISDLKGGQLARYAFPAQIVTLILSDVTGDPIDIIASGPTSDVGSNPLAAINIIKKYGLYEELPESIKTVLNNKENITDFPTDHVRNVIIGSNKISIAAAISAAKSLNFYPVELSSIVTGNVSHIANEYVKLVKLFCDFRKGYINVNDLNLELKKFNIPGLKNNFTEKNNEALSIKNKDLCLILAGETTVKICGNGVGGRNQQLALEFSKNINYLREKLQDHEIYFLSAGTDGIDGPTDAAGAIGYLDLISECEENNIDPETYINNNDTYNFYKNFKKGQFHVITGHTNTNVMDLHLIIIREKL